MDKIWGCEKHSWTGSTKKHCPFCDEDIAMEAVYDAAMAMYRHKHPIIHRPMSDGDDEAYQLIMQYFRACNKAEEVERG